MTHQTLPVRWALRRMPAELQRLPDQVLLQVKLAPPIHIACNPSNLKILYEYSV